jgi:hypothetical protein
MELENGTNSDSDPFLKSPLLPVSPGKATAGRTDSTWAETCDAAKEHSSAHARSMLLIRLMKGQNVDRDSGGIILIRAVAQAL